MKTGSSNTQANVPGFWRRLAVALEPLGSSYAEQLDLRVARLEAEVARYSAGAAKPQQKPSGS